MVEVDRRTDWSSVNVCVGKISFVFSFSRSTCSGGAELNSTNCLSISSIPVTPTTSATCVAIANSIFSLLYFQYISSLLSLFTCFILHNCAYTNCVILKLILDFLKKLFTSNLRNTFSYNLHKRGPLRGFRYLFSPHTITFYLGFTQSLNTSMVSKIHFNLPQNNITEGKGLKLATSLFSLQLVRLVLIGYRSILRSFVYLTSHDRFI